MNDLSLSMVITNTKKLGSGMSPKMNWTDHGGSIGSGFSDDWKVKDNEGTVRPMHCEITTVDGAFCLKDTSGETFINGSTMPIGKNELAKLCHKDEIQVGAYHIRVALKHMKNDHDSEGSLDQLVTDGDGLLANGNADLLTSQQEQLLSDPLLALDEMMDKPEDPERLIKHEEERPPKYEESLNDLELSEQATAITTQQSDGENAMTSSMGLKRILGFGKSLTHKVQSHFETGQESENEMNNVRTKAERIPHQSEGYGMDNNVLDLLEEEVAKSMAPSSQSSESKTHNHLLTGPMLNGMGVDFADSDDMKKMHMLSQELGESLRSCIEGLLELHKQIDNGHFGVMNRSLQPIEDNPLRLGLDYDETIKTMYDADKSLVHLSAPAAISESLKNIRDHNDAVQHATGEALQQILAAFSPQILLRRFNSYKRSQENEQTSKESWAWNMYCSYYEELTSSRQKGFEKLFWQIFEQAYDKKIREKQLEF